MWERILVLMCFAVLAAIAANLIGFPAFAAAGTLAALDRRGGD
jgi:hypothetical protein